MRKWEVAVGQSPGQKPASATLHGLRATSDQTRSALKARLSRWFLKDVLVAKGKSESIAPPTTAVVLQDSGDPFPWRLRTRATRGPAAPDFHPPSLPTATNFAV
jgi:hypothetical protein